MEAKKTANKQSNLEKENKHREITIHDFRTYYTAINSQNNIVLA